MAWLLAIFKYVLQLVVPMAIKELLMSWKNAREIEKAKKDEEAKQKAAQDKYNKERMEAGDDEQAQKDAFDKYVDRS